MSSTGSCAKDEGSCEGAGEECPRREPPVPARWAAYSRRARRWKVWATTPGLLLALGIVLLAVGAALVATPLTIARTRHGGGSASRPQPPPQPASVNAEGVPIGAVPADQQQQQGELADCRAQLRNRTAYSDAAAAAEARLLGAAAAALPRPELQHAADGLPPLLFGTVFWVLVSQNHPWAPEFQAAAATQVDVLNAAFEGLNWRFRLDGVVQVPAAALENITDSHGASSDCSSADDFEYDEGSPADCRSSGSGDAVVEQCLLRWAQLERVLLPPAADDAAVRGSGSTGSGPRNGGGQPDPPSIHVVVCEPQGVNGAALVLGDAASGGQDGDEEGSSTGAPSGGTVLLRRGALWQSRTSLVHQLGHYFGLPHPFPDDKHTCKVDGDGVADTPQQYAFNSGCQEVGDDQHVCPAAQDGPVAASELPVPIVNYMDLTNDTCRRHFTLGQAARMQAMLRWQRPRLFAAASTVPPPQQALAWEAAWQSGLPPAAVQQQQREAVLQLALLALNRSSSAGSSSSGDSVGALVQAAADAAVLYADGWAQAGLAADGQLSTALQSCACLGPDAAGRLLWTGQLNSSYPIAAVHLLLPIQPDSNSTGSSSSSSSGNGDSIQDGAADGDAADAEAGAAGEGAAPEGEADAGWAPEGAAAPAQEAAALVPAPASAPAAAVAAAAGPAATPVPRLSVEVWIGDSLNHTQNQRCTGQLLLQQGQPMHEVRCDAPLPVGRYVTVAFATAPAQKQQQQQDHVCLCEVQALPAVRLTPGSSSGGSDGSPGGAPGSLPAAPLNLTAAVASQSSEAKAGQGGAASAALACWPPQLGRQQCSSTGGERAAWWSLDTGLDGAWVRGLLLSLPLPCMHEAVLGGRNTSAPAAQDCVPPLPANLTVFVGDVPPALLLASTAGSRDGSSVCAAGLAVPAGQPTVIDCGRFIHGRYITVTATAPLGTVLSLCNVQLLGGEELPLSQHMLRQRKPQRRKGSKTPAEAAAGGTGALRVTPAGLQPNATLPIDGDSGSCLLAPAGSSNSSWQLRLDGTYSVLAVRLAATAAAAGPAGNVSQAASSGKVKLSLLDAGSAEVASWHTAGSSSSSSSSSSSIASSSSEGSSVLLELPAATHAAAVRVEGFAALCDLQLLVASHRKLGAYQLAPLASLGYSSSSLQRGDQPQAAGQWQALDAASGSALNTSLASALLDGNPTTCAARRPAATLGGLGPLQPMTVELRLDRPVRLESVRLVASARCNVTVKAAAPRSQGAPRLDLSVAWPAAATCQERLELPAWQPVYAACRPQAGKAAASGTPLLTDRLLLQLAEPTAAVANATADELTLQLCELALFGLPAAAGS